MQSSNKLPLIDVTALVSKTATLEERQLCAHEIDKACRDNGFFRIKGHGVPIELQRKLDSLSR